MTVLVGLCTLDDESSRAMLTPVTMPPASTAPATKVATDFQIWCVRPAGTASAVIVVM